MGVTARQNSCSIHLLTHAPSPHCCSPDGTPLSDNQKKKRAKQAEKERQKAEKAAKQQQEQAKRQAEDVVSVDACVRLVVLD